MIIADAEDREAQADYLASPGDPPWSLALAERCQAARPPGAPTFGWSARGIAKHLEIPDGADQPLAGTQAVMVALAGNPAAQFPGAINSYPLRRKAETDAARASYLAAQQPAPGLRCPSCHLPLAADDYGSCGACGFVPAAVQLEAAS